MVKSVQSAGETVSASSTSAGLEVPESFSPCETRINCARLALMGIDALAQVLPGVDEDAAFEMTRRVSQLAMFATAALSDRAATLESLSAENERLYGYPLPSVAPVSKRGGRS